jgi:uncharacterized protein YkwD
MHHPKFSWIRVRPAQALAVVLTSGLIASCGGGDGGDGSAPSAAVPETTIIPPVNETLATPGDGAVPPVAPDPGAAGTAEGTCALPDFAADLLRQINAARASARTCGTRAMTAAPSLRWDSRLFNAAHGHSADMATQVYFSHTSLDGRTLAQRVTATGYSWGSVGENIAAGQRDVTAVMNSWLASAGHCENIMNPNFRDVGGACVVSSKSVYGRYWTMVLARP